MDEVTAAVRLARASARRQEDASGAGAAAAAAPPPGGGLTEWLYAEAEAALSSGSAAVRITARGLETPLGVLDAEQVRAGERALDEIEAALVRGEASGGASEAELEQLSGRFYTLIPHRIGRARAAISAAVVRTLDEVARKRELLQLM